METVNASIQKVDEKHFIKVADGGEYIQIPISEDKPNEVKRAFNKLIIRLKSGPYTIYLDNVGEDLFSQVAKEYVTQLNREIQEVYSEMRNFELVEE